MKALIQRVSQAKVHVDDECCGSIHQGLMVLLGVVRGDTPENAEKLARKICNYRVFADSQGRMNLSLLNANLELLLVSQFTLAADTQKGNRPGFSSAAEPALAEALYQQVITHCEHLLPKARCMRAVWRQHAGRADQRWSGDLYAGRLRV